MTTFSDDPTTVATGHWLIDKRHTMELGECGWLERLIDFDDHAGWAHDGQLSCAAWLMWRCRLGRSTAFEKLRVAHALPRRPLVRAAFADGTLSYSAVRALTRIDPPGDTIDQTLIDLARRATIVELEYAVRHYELILDQNIERDTHRKLDRRGMRTRRGLNGMGTIELSLELSEIDEIEVILRAFLDRKPILDDTPQPSPAADPHAGVDLAETPDPSPAADADPDPAPAEADDASPPADSQAAPAEADDASPPADSQAAPAEADDASPPADSQGTDAAAAGPTPDPSSPADSGPVLDDLIPWWIRRADAFMAMCRTALDHAHHGHAVGADRYMLHIIRTPNGDTLIDGTPLPAPIADRIACDCATVEHTCNDHGEPLHLGRKSRTWTAAQRRAILVKQKHRCGFPGCQRRVGDIHHVKEWNNGGPTNIDNAIYLCARHHTLTHTGAFTIIPDPDQDHGWTFLRPDGSPINARIAC